MSPNRPVFLMSELHFERFDDHLLEVKKSILLKYGIENLELSILKLDLINFDWFERSFIVVNFNIDASI